MFSQNPNQERTISVAITHYNNSKLVHYSWFNILSDPRVSEIIILDDASDSQEFNKLLKKAKPYREKIKVFQRVNNWGAFPNKLQAVSLCENDWVILLDADNTYLKSSLDEIFNIQNWKQEVIYCPGFAYPHFDFRQISNNGLLDFDKVCVLVNAGNFNAPFFNDGNYFFNKSRFVEILKPHWNLFASASDVAFVNYIWLSTGGSLYIVPNLRYIHRIHGESTWVNHQVQSTEVLKIIMERLINSNTVTSREMTLDFKNLNRKWEEPIML